MASHMRKLRELSEAALNKKERGFFCPGENHGLYGRAHEAYLGWLRRWHRDDDQSWGLISSDVGDVLLLAVRSSAPIRRQSGRVRMGGTSMRAKS